MPKLALKFVLPVVGLSVATAAWASTTLSGMDPHREYCITMNQSCVSIASRAGLSDDQKIVDGNVCPASESNCENNPQTNRLSPTGYVFHYLAYLPY